MENHNTEYIIFYIYILKVYPPNYCNFGNMFNFSECGKRCVRAIQAICFVLCTFKNTNLFKQILVSQVRFMLYRINNVHPKQIQSGFNLPLYQLYSEEGKEIRQKKI